MGISVPLGRPGTYSKTPQIQSKTKRMEPSPSKAEPSASRIEEGQSSRSGSPGPSFIGVIIQKYIQDSLKGTLEDIKKSNTYLAEQVNYQVRVLVQAVNHNFQQLFNIQATQTERITRMENMMRVHFNIPIPEPPPTEPLQPFIDPENPSVTPIIIPDIPATTTPPATTTTPPPATTTTLFSTPTFHPNPLGDPILQSPSHSHHSSSSSSIEEIVITDKPCPCDIPPTARTKSILVLPSSPTFTPHSPAHSSSPNHTSVPSDPMTVMVLHTPPASSSTPDAIPPPASLRVNPPLPASSDITFHSLFTLVDDKKGKT